MRLAFDRLLRADSAMPHMLYVELSNVCNTRCVYCPCPGYHFDEPFLLQDVLEKIIVSLSHQPVDKIIIGGGEPTLHPEFDAFARRLKHCAKFLSVVTNGQWTDDGITAALADGTFDLVEVSVDAGGKEEYEKAREGARYDRLIANLRMLERVNVYRTRRPSSVSG